MQIVVGDYHSGATTASITTLGIMTMSTKGLDVTLNIKTLITMLCHCAECHKAECHVLFMIVLNAFMLSVIVLSGIMLSDIMLMSLC